MWEAEIKDISGKFDLHPAPPQEAQHTFRTSELLEPEGMRTFLACYGPMMKALDDKATAAYFGGWFASVALAVQYSLSVYSAVPVIILQNLSVHLIPANGFCRVAFSLEPWSMATAPEGEEERKAWRSKVFETFYHEHAAPLLSTLSAVSGLALTEIWGQQPTKFNYYVELLSSSGTDLNGSGDRLPAGRILEDYSALKELDSSIFGLRRNPFQVTVRKIEALDSPDKSVNMRNRCCQYYRTEGGSYCYTCPRLKEEERAARRTEFRRAAAEKQA
ncbi:(2Fe-2S)-binding protein ['Paenibacillus yunnanensis' Narsing Rao et al. 2020]|uniref:(2Fe-2S)-binding protein n=1 Tax=Paenibacillus tengchongensis TaxID=2608684 RepID=UPI00124D6847|nr:(2Fe-2S)-binding protein [Paenibacillus tengchongensis]